MPISTHHEHDSKPLLTSHLVKPFPDVLCISQSQVPILSVHKHMHSPSETKEKIKLTRYKRLACTSANITTHEKVDMVGRLSNKELDVTLSYTP